MIVHRALAFVLVVLSSACGAAARGEAPPRTTAIQEPAPKPVATVATADAKPKSELAPSLDDVLAQAATAGKPVLLDFGAAWCVPCAELAKTMATPDVQRALSAFRVQTYETDDDGAGAAAGDRFDAKALPLLVVLGPDGAEIDRAGDVREAAQLVAWLDARAKIAARGALTDARLSGEADALVFLLAAKSAHREGDEARADRLYAVARDKDPKDARGIASEAAFALLRGRARADAQRDHAKLLYEYVVAFPGSKFATRALEGIAALPRDARPSEADLARAFRLVLGEPPADATAKAWYARLEYELGLTKTVPDAGGHAFASPTDPLADAPAGGGASPVPPAVLALFQRDAAVGTRIGKECASAPRPANVKDEPVRAWITRGAVTRALLLDPEADPALKACVERAAASERDLPPGYGEVHEWSVRFAVNR